VRETVAAHRQLGDLEALAIVFENATRPPLQAAWTRTDATYTLQYPLKLLCNTRRLDVEQRGGEESDEENPRIRQAFKPEWSTHWLAACRSARGSSIPQALRQGACFLPYVAARAVPEYYG
jgi:hypothetical protein